MKKSQKRLATVQNGFSFTGQVTNDEIGYSMVKRAEEAAGFEAIVLTVDTVMLGWREEDVSNQYSPLKQGFGKANYETDPVFLASIPITILTPSFKEITG